MSLNDSETLLYFATNNLIFVKWRKEGGKTNENHTTFVWSLMNKPRLEPNSGSGFECVVFLARWYHERFTTRSYLVSFGLMPVLCMCALFCCFVLLLFKIKGYISIWNLSFCAYRGFICQGLAFRIEILIYLFFLLNLLLRICIRVTDMTLCVF